MISFRLFAILVVGFSVAACGSGVTGASAASCDLVAAPGGDDGAAGTVSSPLRTPQRVIDRLKPGQTGCLRDGIYDDRTSRDGYVARFGHGGRPGAPLALRSFPGERVVLKGVVYVPAGADDVTISDLTIDDPTSFSRSGQITVQINARRTTLRRTEITSGSRKTCVILGRVTPGRRFARRSSRASCTTAATPRTMISTTPSTPLTRADCG
ncbi:MAG: hypothetical protein WKF94_01010 [Solirubrobacteraceae bacterium]